MFILQFDQNTTNVFFDILCSAPYKYGTNKERLIVLCVLCKNAFESLCCLLCMNIGIAKSFHVILQKVGVG